MTPTKHELLAAWLPPPRAHADRERPRQQRPRHPEAASPAMVADTRSTLV